jgi:hypothetical protein
MPGPRATCCTTLLRKVPDSPGYFKFISKDDILLEVLEIALLALLVPNFSQLELVTYIVIDSLVLGLELEKN